jgi:hypothetical protein
MLIEHLQSNISDIKVLQANTDGVTIMIKEDDRQLMHDVCDNWMELTGLILEYDDYRKMIIRDVNNYIGVKDKEDKDLYPQFPESDIYDNFYTLHKSKGGAFQVVPEQNGKIAYNKDWSFRIIQKALYNYFIYDIPVKKTLFESRDIFDFCGRYKNTAGWTTKYVDRSGNASILSKTTRYYISNKGGRLYKVNDDGREQSVEAYGKTLPFNKYIEYDNFEEYDINYSYYFQQCNSIINTITSNGNLKLF